MCGIAGIWNLNNKTLERDSLIRFTDSLSERGPDGAGYTILENNTLGLGHRRLSILDLSDAGKQPMKYAENDYVITFNGEIYNFIEIRAELKNKGYSFRTESDTEVLLAAYHHWGKACLTKLNGMFAFVIWDKKRELLFAARDRFGVKPLHYVFIFAELFAFASETFAFDYLDNFQRKTDERKLSIALVNPDYLEGSGHTIFQNIFQLLPGHYMELKRDTTRVIQHKWWETLTHVKPVSGNYNEQVEQFTELFEDACKIRLRSDVPVASALSGGMDSSAIYCVLNRIIKEQPFKQRFSQDAQQAFVAYFPNTPNDERKYAEEVINYTGGKAFYIEPDYSNITSELIKTTKRFDAIAATPIMCATDVYKDMFRKGIRVSIDGHGADEMLYGYKQMVFNAYQTAILKGDELYANDLLYTYTNLFFDEHQERANQSLSAYGNSIRPSLKKKVAQKFFPGYFEKRDTHNLYTRFKTTEMCEEWLTSRDNMFLEPLSDKHFENFISGNTERDTYNLFHYTSLPINLRDFDRASMQNSIEIRSPFMDWRLVTFVFSLPTSSKVGGGFTKRILRDSMKNKMPESIRTRKLKIGLSAPLASWFSNQLSEFIYDEVSSESFQSNAIWDGKIIKEYVEKKRKAGWENFDECAELWKYLSANLIIK